MNEAALAELITSLTHTALALNPAPAAQPTGLVWQTDYPNIEGKNRDPENRKMYADLATKQQAKADATLDTAGKPTEFETRLGNRALAIDKWDSGESGPKDVRNLPYDTAIPLFNDARAAHDSGRVGHGLNTMADGTNPNFGMAIDKQNDMERELAAKGALEQHVDTTLENNKADMYNLANMGSQRNMQVAGIANQGYQAAQDRAFQSWMGTRQPNFFRQLAMQAAQGAGQGAAAAA